VLGPWVELAAGKERFTGQFAEEANGLLSRDYRKPYVVPEEV